jgi:hypothetical protein
MIAPGETFVLTVGIPDDLSSSPEFVFAATLQWTEG